MSRLRRGRAHFVFIPVATFALGSAVFASYLFMYRVRHFTMPVGFDTSWYVWRARFVGDQGLGALGTSVRPGHSVLSSILGTMVDRPQLEMAVVLPLVLVPVFALALGSFVSVGLGVRRWEWGIAVAVAAGLLGATRLAGENVSNLLLLALVAAGLAALARSVAQGRGLAGAVLLFVAGGLAHWTFLVVVGAILLIAALLAVPGSRRAVAAGTPLLRTETGALVVATGATAAAMLVAILAVLRAPFSTFEIREDPRRFLPKLREDLSRLVLPLAAPAAALGAIALGTAASGRARTPSARRPADAFVLRILAAWTIVCAAGIAYGAITKDLPPHRFLMLLVAMPGVVAMAAAVWWVGNRIGGRSADRSRIAGSPWLSRAVMVVTAAVLAVPGALAWYGHGPGLWFDRMGLQQTESAAAYIELLPPRTPYVFLLGPLGPAGLISIPLKERNIRAGLPTDRELDAHFFVGDPADVLAGRRTRVDNPEVDRVIEPYWEDVRGVLPSRPPVIALRSFGPIQYQSALRAGARQLAPGVALLQGPPPTVPIASAPPPRAVPRFPRGVVLGAALLFLLGAAGIGWSFVVFGPDAPPEVTWSAAPALGAAALILSGVIAAKIGVKLAGVGGVITYLVATLGGAIGGWATTRRRGRGGEDASADLGRPSLQTPDYSR